MLTLLKSDSGRLGGSALLLSLLLLLVAGLYWYIPRSLTPPPRQPALPLSEEAARSLERRLAVSLAPLALGLETSLRLEESEANHLLTPTLAKAGLAQASLRFPGQGRLEMQLVAAPPPNTFLHRWLRGQPVPVRITALPTHVEGGRLLHLQVQEVWLGRLPVPAGQALRLARDLGLLPARYVQAAREGLLVLPLPETLNSPVGPISIYIVGVSAPQGQLMLQLSRQPG